MRHPGQREDNPNCKGVASNIVSNDLVCLARIEELKIYINHANRQIDQIRRRVPQELELRVCILEDQYGLLLHHWVMEKETDDKVAVGMITSAQDKFPNLRGCSFDKGFYSPSNKKELRIKLDTLPLYFPPGDACQFDWSHETAIIKKAIFNVSRWPHGATMHVSTPTGLCPTDGSKRSDCFNWIK